MAILLNFVKIIIKISYMEEQIRNCRIVCGDNMEYMKNISDKYFDLAVVDPPYFKGVANENFYGSKISSTGVKRLCSKSDNWDSNIPTAGYYNELVRVSKNQIIWGCNYFKFLQPIGRLVWDKQNDSSTFSNCEIASISMIDSVKIFRYIWNGMLQGNMKEKEIRIHPTQKPIKLYEWIYINYAKEGMKILDTHLGSGSSAIAAYNVNMNLDFTGIEIDEEYYRNAIKRIRYETLQESLF